MIPALTAALGWLNPKRILYLAIAAASAFAIWQGAQFVDARYEAEARAVALAAEVAKLETDINTLVAAALQREAAQRAADAARDQIDAFTATYATIRQNAAAASEEDNAPLAPVLRDALRALDRM